MHHNKAKDRNPYIPAAGIRSSTKDGSAGDCLRSPAGERPPTPEHLLRFRSTFLNEPGAKSRNYVTATDPPPRPASFAYGIRSAVDESASALLSAPPRHALLVQAQEDYEERTFLSQGARPLGRSSAVSRGVDLPAHTREPAYRFGCESDKSQSAKDLLHPYDVCEEADAAVVDRYKRSHRAYAPGEQRKRGFALPGDPAKYRYGCKTSQSSAAESVCAALQWHNNDGTDSHTEVVVPAHMERLHARTQPPIGVSKSVALVASGQVPDRVFGAVSRADEVRVADLVHNSLPEELQRPDPELGRAVKRPGTAPRSPGAAERVFGVPSIRTDVVPPRNRSLDDRQNYGAEKGAWELVNPSPYHPLGVSETDFLMPMGREELRGLMAAAGVVTSAAEFDAAFDAAAAVDRRGLVSIESFRKVRERMQAPRDAARVESQLARSRGGRPIRR